LTVAMELCAAGIVYMAQQLIIIILTSIILFIFVSIFIIIVILFQYPVFLASTVLSIGCLCR